MSSRHKRHEAISKFVRNNFYLLAEKGDFDKESYRNAKEAYFAKKLGYQYGIPKDKEIGNILIEIIIKNERLEDTNMLRERIAMIPFLKLQNFDLQAYDSLLAQIKRACALIEDASTKIDAKKILAIKKSILEEKSEEIEAEKRREEENWNARIKVKEEEYKRLPSILDDQDFDEPDEPPEVDETKEWWEDLNLRANPFPSLQGFLMIDKSLYDDIAVETEPIQWMLKKLRRDDFDIFHKGYLVRD